MISIRKTFFKVDWDIIINDRNSIHVNVQNLSNKILQSANENIPNIMITVRHNDLPWLNNEIRKLMRKRYRARRKAKKSKTLTDWTTFKLRNKVGNLIRSAKRIYFNKLHVKISEEKFGSKDWWKLVKQVSGLNNNSQNEIKVLIDNNDCAINNNTEKANMSSLHLNLPLMTIIKN